jgi:hypothetical protein
MVFLAVKGDPDACGKGCSEWIAAEGLLDADASKRLRDFLRSDARRKLPVFFHSIGGGGLAGVLVAQVLREFRMSVSVGRSVVASCAAVTLAAGACRSLNGGNELKARLVAGFCNSACVFALIGGAVRKIPDDAYVGVHSGKMTGPQPITAEEIDRIIKRNVFEFGVDPGLLDLGARTPAEKMHKLTRAELTKLGVPTGGFYETGWLVYPWQGKFEIAKAWRRPTAGDGAPSQVTLLRIGCSNNEHFEFTLKRERMGDENPSTVDISVVLENVSRAIPPMRRTPLEEFRQENFSAADVLAATSKGGIKIQESVAGGQQAETKLSSAGLAPLLADLKTRCGQANARAQ